MLLVILFCEENCFLASRAYAQRYPNRNLPDKRSVEKLLVLFRRAGSVVYIKVIRQPVIRTEENEFVVIGSFIENLYIYKSS